MLVVQREKHVELMHRRPAPQSPSTVHSPAGRSWQTPVVSPDGIRHTCPVGHVVVAEQPARHCWFTHTLPAPHCESNWQVSERGVQRFPTHTCPEAHSVSAVHEQLVVPPSQVGRVQVPFTHTVPPVQSVFVLQVPGLSTGVSVGLTQSPRVAPAATRQTHPCAH